MDYYDEMKDEAARVIRENMPSADIVRVDAEPTIDSQGDDSLSITINVRQRPSREESQKLVRAVGQFRTWLAAHDDVRFPFFRLLSEADVREMQQTDS